MWIRKRILMNKEGGDGGNGSGAGAADAGGGAASSGGDAGTGGQPAGAAGNGTAAAGADDQSLLASIGQGGAPASAAGGAAGDQPTGTETPEQLALKAAEKDTRRPQHVPAKFWNAEKGEVNFEAWANSTKSLETRMKDIGLPPKTSDEYKFEAPQELRDAGLDLDPVRSKGFRDKALTIGLTQKQYGEVMAMYFDELGEMAVHSARVGADRLKSDLLAHYKTPEALQENVAAALNVVKAFGDEQEVAAALGPQGNTPAWVYRVLAKINKEMGEDPGINPDGILDGESLDELMKGKPGDEDSPYWNPKHPQHKAVKAKVAAHHAALAAAAKRKAA